MPVGGGSVDRLLFELVVGVEVDLGRFGARVSQPERDREDVDVLRHTNAMRLLHADVDTTVIALWLGHEQVETTQMYLHADLAIKERALARTTPLDSKPGRYRPPAALLGFLDGL